MSVSGDILTHFVMFFVALVMMLDLILSQIWVLFSTFPLLIAVAATYAIIKGRN